MEFTIEVGEPGLTSEPPPSAPAAVNPAHEAALAEHAKVMTDPKHPHYEGFRQNTKAANAYVDALYQKAFPKPAASTPPAPPEGNQTETLTDAGPNDVTDAQELAQFRDDVATEGVEFDTAMKEAGELAQVIIMADQKLYFEAARRLGDGLALRLLRLIRQRVNLS